MLGFLQFLTPDREALAAVVEGDLDARTLVMANASSNSAQLDACKASKMYCSGRLSTFRHSYEAFCNLRLLLSLMVEDVDAPLLVWKLTEYVTLLIDCQGRIFFETGRNSPHLAIHPWQDLQHILTAFVMTAIRAELYQPVMKGEAVALINYANAIAVADNVISDLRAILNGNGLGKFAGTPCCAAWFASRSREPTKVRPVAGNDREGKRQRLEPGDVDTRKSKGLLTLDAEAAGTSRLPNVGVYHKKKGAKAPERICMPFMTQGYACTARNCAFPHISNIAILAEAERKKLLDVVEKTPGLNWAEGKAPSGTK